MHVINNLKDTMHSVYVGILFNSSERTSEIEAFIYLEKCVWTVWCIMWNLGIEVYGHIFLREINNCNVWRRNLLNIDK